ncbi:MAG: radical SAM protein [Pseudonocardiales bacterium]
MATSEVSVLAIPEPSVVIMQPTTLCNLDCSYCYLPHRAHRRIMSLNVARATAQAVGTWAYRRPVNVVWHGGEPLTAGRVHLGALMDSFPDHGITHSVQTNATLIDQRWCEFFTK